MLADWFGRLFQRWLRPVWVPLLLILAIYSVVTLSIDEANWIKGDRVLVRALLLGMVLGLATARSTYQARFSLPYILCMAVLAGIQAAARIVPSLAELARTPPAEVTAAMNLRGFEFRLRMLGWVDTLAEGGKLEDTGLFVLLFCILLTLLGAWWLWATVRNHQPLAGLLPVGVLLALNLHLRGQPLGYYMVFLLCALLLVAYENFNGTHRTWQARHVDYPDQLGLEWGATAFAIALALVCVARLVPLFATQEGQRVLAGWFDRAREQTSTTAERLFSGVRPPQSPQSQAVPPARVATPSLAEIGAPIPQGKQTILWVQINDPPPPPHDLPPGVQVTLPPVHYWRSQVYGTYTGRGWLEADPLAAETEDSTREPEPQAGRYLLRQRFEMVALHDVLLFSVNDPLQVQGGSLRGLGDPETHRVEGDGSQYEVISQATDVTADQLAGAPLAYPPYIQESYLSLPDSLPERVRALAQRIAADAPNPYARVLRVQAYLRENFPYDLNPGTAPPGSDVVDYFLFTQQRGFCSHYASAMAVMLRALGIPARVASGYAMGNFDTGRGAYHVTEDLSHAWVEVYFPGYGWVEFEPTVARAEIRYPAETAASQTAPVTPVPGRSTSGGARVVVWGLLAGLLLALPWLLLRRFQRARQPVLVQVTALYRQVRRALAQAGLEAPPGMTPDEYRRYAAQRLVGRARLSTALERVTTLYREASYSPRLPGPRSVRIAEQYWQQALGEWLILWLRCRLRRR